MRDNWGFDYTAAQLAQAAALKVVYHQERVNWWKDKRTEVMKTIRAEGLEVNEKISMEFRNPKSNDWSNSSQVMVRNDLQNALKECQEKLVFHTEKLKDYSGWQQMLSANPQTTQRLDIGDWLFFFSQDPSYTPTTRSLRII